ncbi:MAG: 50S ribosomal protein L28 [Chloroflexi bacterium]|nr:50S ribosomal protein L28 [Chloroflexota bacterium]
MKCEICQKAPIFGHNVSHSNRKTNRAFQPNVQQRAVTIDGQRRRVAICTRCLRTMQKIA